MRAERTSPETVPSAEAKASSGSPRTMSRLAMTLSPQSGSTSGDPVFHRPLGIGHDGQLLVVDVDQVESRVGGELVLGDDRRHRLAHVAGAVDAERVPADALRADGGRVVRLRDRVHALGDLATGEHVEDAGQRLCFRRVYAADARVRERAPQHGRVGHPRQLDVVHELAAPGDELDVRQAGNRLSHVGQRTSPLPVAAIWTSTCSETSSTRATSSSVCAALVKPGCDGAR